MEKKRGGKKGREGGKEGKRRGIVQLEAANVGRKRVGRGQGASFEPCSL